MAETGTILEGMVVIRTLSVSTCFSDTFRELWIAPRILAVLDEDLQIMKLHMLFYPSYILNILISICSQTS